MERICSGGKVPLTDLKPDQDPNRHLTRETVRTFSSSSRTEREAWEKTSHLIGQALLCVETDQWLSGEEVLGLNPGSVCMSVSCLCVGDELQSYSDVLDACTLGDNMAASWRSDERAAYFLYSADQPEKGNETPSAQGVDIRPLGLR